MTLCYHSWSFVRQYLDNEQQFDQWPYNVSSLDVASGAFFLRTSDTNDSSDLPVKHLKWANHAVAEVFGHWCRYDSPSKLAHAAVGVLLLALGLTGILGNGTVIIVFIWYRRLRTPPNTLIVNLAISDFLMSVLHPMAGYSSFFGYWQFGRIACDWYAALCGLFGLVSIVSLSFLALERCLVISIKPWYGELHVTAGRVKFVAFFTWFYCLVCVAPPFFGLGKYVPEGLLTSCSFDYITRDIQTRVFFYMMFSMGFFVPLSVIVICYTAILVTICKHENDMIKANIKNVNKTFKASSQCLSSTNARHTGSLKQHQHHHQRESPVRSKIRSWRLRSDLKSAEMILIIIGVFLLSWTPYAIVAILGQFGDLDLLTPWMSYVPCIFAKMSTMYNPFIYGLSHQRFRSSLCHMIGKTPKGGSLTAAQTGRGVQANGQPYVSRQQSGSQQSVKSNRTFRSVVVKVGARGIPKTELTSSSSNPQAASSEPEVKSPTDHNMSTFKECVYCQDTDNNDNGKIAQAEAAI